jgi:hypothetical protein
MQNQNHKERWEASMLATAMALVGGAALFDKLGTLVRASIISFQSAFHSSPVLLVVVIAGLLLALYRVATAEPVKMRGKGAQHEL